MSPNKTLKPEPEWTGAPVVISQPKVQLAPLVVASPHSGRIYPDQFVSAARLDPLTLRRSEDALMDLLVQDAPSLGLPLVAAQFPRAFCDANREPFELDPQMFSDALPHYANTRSVRVACGLGTIARVVSDGHEIYRNKLKFSQAKARIDECYMPYHQALADEITATRDKFGKCMLLDMHSMPSVGGPMDQDSGHGRADIVLGDRYGTSASPAYIKLLETLFRSEGLRVARNIPYAGGHTTLLHGRPGKNSHALQIEINRALYLDELSITPSDDFEELRHALNRVLAALVQEFGAEGSTTLAAE